MADDGIAYVLNEDPPHELYADIQDCVELCPVAAINVVGA